MKREVINNHIKEAKDWASIHLNKPIKNKETGFPISVTLKGIDHTLKHDLFVDKSGRFMDLLSLIKKFKIILKDAKKHETRADKYGDLRVLIHEFRYSIILKGIEENLQIIVKELITDEKKMIGDKSFYNHRFIVDEIKKP